MEEQVHAILAAATVEGNSVKLPPGQLERALYEGVARKLTGIGGKWKGGKTQAFIFAIDPTDRLAELRNGKRVKLKQDFQFFATPDGLADTMVLLAGIAAGHTVLEPSAGEGIIVKAILRLTECRAVDCYELMPENRIALAAIPGARLIGEDFLLGHGLAYEAYDRIIANPPFTRNADIVHIWHMWNCLNAGGRLVTLASTSWQSGMTRKQRWFRLWLDEIGAEVSPVPRGTFKASGTNVGAVMIVADKPKGEG